MTAPTFTISASERDWLHGLMLRRLLVLGENPFGLAKAEGITVEEQCEQFGDDLRLMEEIGWVFETDQESVELTMPPERLTEALKRLRGDARPLPIRCGTSGSRRKASTSAGGASGRRWKFARSCWIGSTRRAVRKRPQRQRRSARSRPSV